MITDDFRVDLFLSFHGNRLLHQKFITRDIVRHARLVLKKIANEHGAQPNIFFDEDGARVHLGSDISTAILQLRGGGLGICLLTRE